MTTARQLPVKLHQALSPSETYAIEIVDQTLSDLVPQPEQLEVWFQEGCEHFQEATVQAYDRAATLWRRAAEHGHLESQFNLADCYSEGEGVAKNPTQGPHE